MCDGGGRGGKKAQKLGGLRMMGKDKVTLEWKRRSDAQKVEDKLAGRSKRDRRAVNEEGDNKYLEERKKVAGFIGGG